MLQLSKKGYDFYHNINEFVRLINDQFYEDNNKEQIRSIRIKQMSDENESFKAEIISIDNQMKIMDIDYDEKVKDYNKEKEHYDELIKNAYQKADLNKTVIE